MNKIIIVVIIITISTAGGYLLAEHLRPPPSPTSWQIATELQQVNKHVVAERDIVQFISLCPTDNWLIFKGESKVVLAAKNRYSYTIDFAGKDALIAKRVGDSLDTFNVDVNIETIGLLMDASPSVQGFVVDSSYIVNEEAAKLDFQQRIFERLRSTAYNYLASESDKEAIKESIKNFLYRSYAKLPIKLNNISVNFGEKAIPAPQNVRWKEECEGTFFANTDIAPAQTQEQEAWRGSASKPAGVRQGIFYDDNVNPEGVSIEDSRFLVDLSFTSLKPSDK